MSANRARVARDDGQALVISLVFLTVMLAMAAATIDVGAWYRAHREAQATADAAALAAAQELPATTTSAATSLALEYASKNGGGLVGGDVSYSTKLNTNDTVTVRVRRPAPLFFAKVLGITSVTAVGKSMARSEPVGSARYVAPIVVHYKHQFLNCTQAKTPKCDPEFGRVTTLTLSDLHSPGGGSAAGAFGLINLNKGDGTGTADANTLAGWLASGYDGYLDPGIYFSAPSANFNNGQFLAALESVKGTEVLFPVYRLLTGPGSNAKYDIIGFVGFYIQAYTADGSNGTITGYFSRFTAEGFQVESGGTTDTGAVKVELVDS